MRTLAEMCRDLWASSQCLALGLWQNSNLPSSHLHRISYRSSCTPHTTIPSPNHTSNSRSCPGWMTYEPHPLRRAVVSSWFISLLKSTITFPFTTNPHPQQPQAGVAENKRCDSASFSALCSWVLRFAWGVGARWWSLSAESTDCRGGSGDVRCE